MIRTIRLGSALTAALVVLAMTPGSASAWSEEGEELDVVSHSADGYYWDFTHGFHIELPRIFVMRDAEGGLGVDFFWSSTAAVLSGHYLPEWADDGHEAAPADDHAEGVDDHSADADASATEDTHAEPAEDHAASEGRHDYYYAALTPPAGGTVVVDMSVTRQLLFAWFSMLIVAITFISIAGRYKKGVGRETAPKGRLQNMLETLILFVRDEIARPNLGDKTDKYLPYLLTAFFFILTANLLGLVPFGVTATANIMVTAVLATITFVLTQLGGSRDHWRHIFNPPGVPLAVKPILIPVEILGLFTKPFALAIRLFANMTAGHLVILSLIGLIFSFANLFGDAAGYGVSVVSVAFALFIYCLELLVSFIQAYVFTLLSALFIGMAVAEHDHDDHHAHESGGHGETPEIHAGAHELAHAS
ncbi:MAG: F-type H+-transporting ATPase subunit a [Rhodothermales bacterium]|jgi:F-type H+-transporting ATPase subunit a